MKKSVKTILIILSFFAFGLLLHFGVFEKLLNSTPFVKDYYNNGILTINTRNGIAEVTVNGQQYGQTPQSISNLPEEKYLVELEKVSEDSNLYKKQSFYIELFRNTEAIIDIEIGPDDFKSGHILYYTEMSRSASNKGALTLRTDLQDYEVSIDNEKIDKEKLFTYLLDPKEYDIKISSNGHESLEFPIIIRDGYNLNVRIYLLPIPIKF
jgi:hypothetical protein